MRRVRFFDEKSGRGCGCGRGRAGLGSARNPRDIEEPGMDWSTAAPAITAAFLASLVEVFGDKGPTDW